MMQITGKHYFVIYNKLVSDFFFSQNLMAHLIPLKQKHEVSQLEYVLKRNYFGTDNHLIEITKIIDHVFKLGRVNVLNIIERSTLYFFV